MSTSRVLDGLIGFAKGCIGGAAIGATSGLLGGAISKNLMLIDSPTLPIAAAGAIGWTLLGGSVGAYQEYKNLQLHPSSWENEYDKAGLAALLTTAASVSGSLLLKALKQPQPPMKELIPAMLIGATVFHCTIEWFAGRKEQIEDESISVPSLKL